MSGTQSRPKPAMDWWSEIAPPDTYKYSIDKHLLDYNHDTQRKYDDHLYLNLAETRPGFVVKYSLPYKYLPNNDFVKEHVALKENCQVDEVVECDKYSNRVPSSLFQKKQAPNEESLNDEDIDMLFAEKETVVEVKEEVLDLKEKSCPSHLNNDHTFIHKLLLVGEDAFCLAGSPTITRLRGSISDCTVINTTSNRKDDIVLVVQSSGMVYSIIPSKRTANVEKDITIAGSTVLQYCNLLAADDWKIITDPSICKDNDFILMGTKTRILKFFKYTSEYGFKFINNMYMNDFKLHDCSFFVNERPPSSHGEMLDQNTGIAADSTTMVNQSPKMLFIATEHSDRVMYICVEWTANSEYHKNAHQLPYLTGEPANGVFPVQHNKVVSYTNNTMTLISANQIMSGESSFVANKLPTRMRGIISSFAAPDLLDKLKLQNFDMFSEFIDCHILASATGTVFACLFGNEDFTFLPLTRQKGLRDICPVPLIQSVNIDPEHYTFTTMAFNRLCEVKIDISKISLDDNGTNSYKEVISRRVKHIASDDNYEIALIEGDIWAFSNSSVSQLSARKDQNLTMPYLHLNELLNDNKTFGLYKSIEISDFRNDQDLGSAFDVELDGYLLMITAKKGNGSSDTFLVTSKDDFFHAGSRYEMLKVEETFDSGFDNNSKRLLHRVYNKLLICVNPASVTVSDLDTRDKKMFLASFEIEGAVFKDGILVIWDKHANECKICYDLVENWDDGNDILNFESIEPLNSIMQSFSDDVDFSFVIDNSLQLSQLHQISLIIRSATKFVVVNIDLKKINVDDNSDCVLIRNYLDSDGLNDSFITLDGLYVYHIEGALIGYLILDGTMPSKTIETLTLPTGRKDVQLKRYTDRSIIAFTTYEAFIVEFKNSEGKLLADPFVYKMKMPYLGKHNYIKDISFCPKGNLNASPLEGTLAVLTSNGFKLMEPMHISWLYSNYLLQNTRSTNKKFIYLTKLNRLLIINGDTSEWYCMKLQNGKILPLDNAVLERDLQLINALDASVLFGDPAYETLMLNYGTKIKLVKLSTQGNRIVITPFWEYSTNANFSKHVDIIKEYMYVQEIGTTDSEHTSGSANSPLDSMLQFSYNTESDTIELAHKHSFLGKGEMETFVHASPDFGVYSTQRQDYIFRRPNLYTDPLFHEKYLHPVEPIPYDFKIVKMMALSPETYVVIYNCLDDILLGSKIVFYCTKRNCFLRNHPSLGHEKEDEAIKQSLRKCQTNNTTVFDALVESHDGPCRLYPQTKPVNRRRFYLNDSDTLSYSISFRPIKRVLVTGDYEDYPVSGSTPVNTTLPTFHTVDIGDMYLCYDYCQPTGEYRDINMSMPVLDASYDPETKMLAVLQANQSVALFNTDPLHLHVTDRATEQQRSTIFNYGSYVPALAGVPPPQNEGAVLSEIDYYGRVWDDGPSYFK